MKPDISLLPGEELSPNAPRPSRRSAMKRIRLPALLLVVIVIGVLHAITPGDLLFYHDTYRRLSFFPIALGGLWYGVPGGLGIAVASSVAYIPHLIIFADQHPAMYLGELTEIILYLAAGTLIGAIAGKEARLREQYRLLSEKLEKSYARLQRQTELLLDVEAQLGASQRLSALGRLSASLAHEIKNPLGSIRGTAEILLDEFPEDHPKREFAEILLKETARLNTTVDNILRYSRGQQQAEQTEPLSRVLARVVRLLAGQLREKGILFRLRENEETAPVLVDGARLSQVFLNLILNAIDALPGNGRITVETRRQDGGIAVTVRDNGPGVPLSERERIFEPFVSGKDDGTGLGLSISRKIVESYGGSIEVTTAPEGGACFTVFLPPGDTLSRALEETAGGGHA